MKLFVLYSVTQSLDFQFLHMIGNANFYNKSYEISNICNGLTFTLLPQMSSSDIERLSVCLLTYLSINSLLDSFKRFLLREAAKKVIFFSGPATKKGGGGRAWA